MTPINRLLPTRRKDLISGKIFSSELRICEIRLFSAGRGRGGAKGTPGKTEEKEVQDKVIEADLGRGRFWGLEWDSSRTPTGRTRAHGSDHWKTLLSQLARSLAAPRAAVTSKTSTLGQPPYPLRLETRTFDWFLEGSLRVTRPMEGLAGGRAVLPLPRPQRRARPCPASRAEESKYNRSAKWRNRQAQCTAPPPPPSCRRKNRLASCIPLPGTRRHLCPPRRSGLRRRRRRGD